MKRFACLIILTLSVISCSQESSTHEGEIQMSEILSVQLFEEQNSQDVEAVVRLSDSPDVPEYTKAELYINDLLIGEFQNGQLSYYPKEFGDIDCLVKFDDTKVIADTLKLYIETWFIQYNSSENGDTKQPIEGENVVLTPSNVTYGSLDMIWMYNLRVPKDKEITFHYESIKLVDNAPNFSNNKLDVHFRYGDYAERYDLYPDEPYVAKYIDAEVEKWVSPPVTLTHGIHNLYVCPNSGADKSYITVIHSGEHNGSFSANYKSIVRWPAK